MYAPIEINSNNRIKIVYKQYTHSINSNNIRLYVHIIYAYIVTARICVLTRLEAYSESCQTSKMECLAKIVNGLQPFFQSSESPLTAGKSNA